MLECKKKRQTPSRMPRHLIQTPILLALLLQASHAKALGFGNASGLTALGRPLAFSVSLRFEPGELIEPACVAADVDVGDRRLPPDQVVARLVRDGATGERRIRVSTSVPVDEPSLTVTVRAGCPPRLTRGFVVFADPPHTLPHMADASGPADEAVEGGGSNPGPFGAAAAPASAPVAAAPRRPARPARSAPASRAAALPNASAPPADAGARSTSPPVARKAPAPAPARSRAPERPQRPVLQLDAPEDDERSTPTPEPATASASAVMPATDAAELARRAQDEARLKALEASVQQLLAERRTKDQALDALQARVRAAEQARYANPVTYALAALCLLLAGAVVGLFLLRRRDQARAAWWTAEAARAAEPESLLKPEPADDWSSPAKLGDGPALDLRPRRPPVAAPVAPEGSAGIAPTAAAAVDSTSGADLADGGLRRPMSAEELIDLEQQVEFFVVLGQDEAAIDLLMGHVRSTSGVSPLPYLKLLEIYRRRDEREPYERIRERFNRRFNAYAPEWGVDPESGNSLEGYPDVLGRVQGVWQSPADAMAILDRLLFRREAGPTFDVPAYRELLFLYGISRDLAERDVPASGVDLLLPLGEGDEGVPPPAPYPAASPAVEPFTLNLEAQPEAAPRRAADTPLEFDLDLNLDVSPVPPPPREDGTPPSRG
jgi:pilus assembly protein FimV